MSAAGRELLQYFDENRTLMDEQVRLGIELNRKGNAVLLFEDAEGNPVTDVHAEIHQKGHDFRFGANIFMLDELETEEKNEKYKRAFAELFNQATLPFYWADLEPIQGQPRYAKDCPKMYRRPSTDLCVEFCEENGIEPKHITYVYPKLSKGVDTVILSAKKGGKAGLTSSTLILMDEDGKYTLDFGNGLLIDQISFDFWECLV